MEGKPIIGYENYTAWTDGTISTNNWRNAGRFAFLRPATDKKGYRRVALMKDGKLNTLKVHRVIAQAFIPNPENKETVNHINGIKSDNRVENLEWSTRSEQALHAIRTGLWDMSNIAGWNKGITTIKGSEVGTSLLKEDQVLSIRQKFRPRKYTRKMLATEFNVTAATIADIVRRKSWKHL